MNGKTSFNSFWRLIFFSSVYIITDRKLKNQNSCCFHFLSDNRRIDVLLSHSFYFLIHKQFRQSDFQVIICFQMSDWVTWSNYCISLFEIVSFRIISDSLFNLHFPTYHDRVEYVSQIFNSLLFWTVLKVLTI